MKRINKISRSHIQYQLIVILLIFMVVSCTEQNKSNSVDNNQSQIIKSISPDESFKLMQGHADNLNFVILDIRTPQEFNSEHIDGAINIDFYKADFNQNMQNLDKSKIYLIYCRTGNRTGNALLMMKELGFNEVYNMLGGIVQWKSGGFPVKN